MRCSGKIYWRGTWGIDTPEDAAVLLSHDRVAQLHLIAKRSSFWSHRSALVTTKPRRRDRTQSCHAISLTFKASVVQHGLYSCPACFTQCFGPCGYHIRAHPAARERMSLGSLSSFDYISLALGRGTLSFKLADVLPNSSRACAGLHPIQSHSWILWGSHALILSDPYPYFPKLDSSPLLLVILAPTVHA